MATIKREVLVRSVRPDGTIQAQQTSSSASTSPSPSPSPPLPSQKGPKYQLVVDDGISGPNPIRETHSPLLQANQSELMLLEQNNKKRIMKARQEKAATDAKPSYNHVSALLDHPMQPLSLEQFSMGVMMLRQEKDAMNAELDNNFPQTWEGLQMQLMLREQQAKKRLMMARRDDDPLSHSKIGNDFVSPIPAVEYSLDSSSVCRFRCTSHLRAAFEQITFNNVGCWTEEDDAAWMQSTQRNSETQMPSSQEQDAMNPSQTRNEGASSTGVEGICAGSDSLVDDQSSTPQQSPPERKGATKRWMGEELDKKLKLFEEQTLESLRLAKQKWEMRIFGTGNEFLLAVQSIAEGSIFQINTLQMPTFDREKIKQLNPGWRLL